MLILNLKSIEKHIAKNDLKYGTYTSDFLYRMWCLKHNYFFVI